MGFKNTLLLTLGFLTLALGAIGLVLPIWPTTPFVLMSLACFSTSPRIKNWILRCAFFREYAQGYENKTGLSKKTVCISLIWLWGMLVISMVFIKTLWICALLVFIGCAVTWHILCIARGKKK